MVKYNNNHVISFVSRCGHLWCRLWHFDCILLVFISRWGRLVTHHLLSRMLHCDSLVFSSCDWCISCTDLHLYATGFFKFFFAIPFLPFPIILLQWLTFHCPLGLLSVPKKHHQEGQFLPYSSHEQWILLFFLFTQISEHFCPYPRFHWANHSDLGITGKIFSSCRSWV